MYIAILVYVRASFHEKFSMYMELNMLVKSSELIPLEKRKV